MQSVVLGTYLAPLSDQAPLVLASSGNHDLDGPGDHGEQVAGWLQRVHRRPGASSTARRVDVDGIRFTVCPWWDGPLTRDEVGAAARRGSRRPARAVGVGLPLTARPARCCAATAAASSPTTSSPPGSSSTSRTSCICGHIHQAPWAKGGSWHARLGRTQVFNAGKQIGHVPPHITFDTEARTAHWFGVFDSETIDLG